MGGGRYCPTYSPQKNNKMCIGKKKQNKQQESENIGVTRLLTIRGDEGGRDERYNDLNKTGSWPCLWALKWP